MQQGEEILEPEEGQDEEQFEDDFVLEPNDPQPDKGGPSMGVTGVITPYIRNMNLKKIDLIFKQISGIFPLIVSQSVEVYTNPASNATACVPTCHCAIDIEVMTPPVTGQFREF